MCVCVCVCVCVFVCVCVCMCVCSSKNVKYDSTHTHIYTHTHTHTEQIDFFYWLVQYMDVSNSLVSRWMFLKTVWFSRKTDVALWLIQQMFLASWFSRMDGDFLLSGPADRCSF